MSHACNPSPWEAGQARSQFETRLVSRFQGCPRLHRETLVALNKTKTHLFRIKKRSGLAPIYLLSCRLSSEVLPIGEYYKVLSELWRGHGFF